MSKQPIIKSSGGKKYTLTGEFRKPEKYEYYLSATGLVLQRHGDAELNVWGGCRAILEPFSDDAELIEAIREATTYFSDHRNDLAAIQGCPGCADALERVKDAAGA